jgi:branched-chain amino acid transport system substrate-binding protein
MIVERLIRHRGPFRRVMALPLLGILLAAGPAAAVDPGLTSDTIVLGSHQPLSGPAATYSLIPRASEAYFKMINEQGGVHGRRIVYRYEDDTYQPPRTVEVVRKLIERDQVFAIFNGLGTPTHTAVYKYILDRGVPDMYVATGATKWAFPPENGFKPYPGLFGFQPNYLTEGSVFGVFAIQRWGGKKVALLYQNDDFGKDGAEAFKHAIRGKLTVVADDVYEVNAVTVDSQLLKAKNAGADVVYLFAIPKFVGMYLKKASEIGWKPAFLVSAVSNGPQTWKLAGPDCDPAANKLQCANSDGVFTLKWTPTMDERDNPKVARHYALVEKYGSGLKVDNLTLYGQAAAELMVETLRRAGRNLTRESLLKAAESIKGWSDGLVSNITMGPDDHAPVEDLKVVLIKDGKIEKELTDWIQGSRPGK